MMQYPQNEMSCTLSLISSDLENFETVKGLYFGEREKENGQETDDTSLDESSSEVRMMAKPTAASIMPILTCRRKPRLKNLSLIPATENLVTVDWRAAQLFHWVTFMSVETTATNCPQQSLIWLYLEPPKVH